MNKREIESILRSIVEIQSEVYIDVDYWVENTVFVSKGRGVGGENLRLVSRHGLVLELLKGRNNMYFASRVFSVTKNFFA